MNSEFSFSYTSCLTKAEEPSLPYYLPIAGGRIIGFIPFPRGLVLCEMQSVSSRIWTRITVSISYDDNHYTTGTSIIDLTGTDIIQNLSRVENKLVNCSIKSEINSMTKHQQTSFAMNIRYIDRSSKRHKIWFLKLRESVIKEKS